MINNKQTESSTIWYNHKLTAAKSKQPHKHHKTS